MLDKSTAPLKMYPTELHWTIFVIMVIFDDIQLQGVEGLTV